MSSCLHVWPVQDCCRAISTHSHRCHPDTHLWAARRCGRGPTWKRVRSLCSQGMALCRAGSMTPRVLATRMTNTAAMRSLQGSKSASSQDDRYSHDAQPVPHGRGGGMTMPRVLAVSMTNAAAICSLQDSGRTGVACFPRPASLSGRGRPARHLCGEALLSESKVHIAMMLWQCRQTRRRPDRAHQEP